jgi:alanyl-tRNA synthetase
VAQDQCGVLWWNASDFRAIPSLSAESCRRHVAKTGEIKDFVITEESGIAKGIRRIIAVTGHEAAEVTRVADALNAKLTKVEHLEGKEKDAAMKALSIVRLF